ncbi:Methyl-accepting chemotaxis protein McpB [Paraliobacillus sp. PM-2]|uniref:methyl-accepting chemotaxis protein n=1 Tax=Paraliobacillus sp. PM-2 TaxID=1462524 RepID=UPI00061CC959|nr:methyl-accepting chemotaxis protein [Paraliobacillus sp. PM-2]CQR47936.1 Methyl-accepting chemotaxis protein McpB [Paraliobacillus sp. PM-2]
MKRFIQFKSLRTKILIGFMFLVVLILSYSTFTILSNHDMKMSTERMTDEELSVLIKEEKLVYNIANRISLARGYVLYGDISYLEKFKAVTKESEKLEENLTSEHDLDEVKQLVQATTKWQQEVERNVFSEYRRGNEQKAAAYLKNTAEPIANELMTSFESLISEREQHIKASGEDIVSEFAIVNLVGFISAILILIIAILTSLYVARIITKPIKSVKERMVTIASGNLQAEPLEIHTKDEVAELVKAMNSMQDNLKEIVAEIQDVSNTVSNQSNQLTQSSDQVKEASDQVAVTMEELSKGSETQANTTSNISVSMIGFAQKITEADNKGENIYHSSQTMMKLTSNGREEMDHSIEQMNKIHQVVSDAVTQVKGLDEQSKEITKLVNVIKDVAEQTNLLALNAAIEAARAGEHGKGFAVVADEVRKLAEQVATSVTDITRIVKSVQKETEQVTTSLQGGYKEVEAGMNQVVNTGDIFAKINNELNTLTSEIKDISTNLSTINNNSEKMSSGLEEIASVSEESAAGIEETAASIQQTSSSMEEVANNSKQLDKLADHLKKLVAKFKL